MNGLKEKRKTAKLSRRAFSEIIGVSERSLYLYESGQREPKINTLKKLARYFECSIEELL